MNNKKIEKENVLAVEGKDECNFFKALLEYEKLESVQIIDIGGKDKFKIEFPLFAQSENFYNKLKRIGFVRDAEDKEAISAFQSICSVLKACELPVPEKQKVIVNDKNIKLGVFIMPNNEQKGMLEDLCIQSVKNDTLTKYVDNFVDSYKANITDKQYNFSKAYVLAFLSTRVPIVNALGLAALNKVWDFNNSCFDEIKLFLRELFKT
jgi:hypothetical protein